MDDLDPLSIAQPTQGASAGLPLYMDFDPRSFASPQPTQGAAAYLSMSTSSETANRHTWHRGILAAITHHPIYYSRSSTTASVFFEPAIWNMAPRPQRSDTSATYWYRSSSISLHVLFKTAI